MVDKRLFYPIKELTWKERSTWGDCHICHAKHGEECNPAWGICLGKDGNGNPPKDGVHLGRLQHAPTKVKLVPVE